MTDDKIAIRELPEKGCRDLPREVTGFAAQRLMELEFDTLSGAGHGERSAIKAAITKVPAASRQRCRVHFMRDARADAGKKQRRIISTWIATAFAQGDAAAARAQWRQVAD